MPVLVIDELELIDIHDEDGHRRAGALRAGRLAADQGIPSTAIERAGERVDKGTCFRCCRAARETHRPEDRAHAHADAGKHAQRAETVGAESRVLHPKKSVAAWL